MHVLKSMLSIAPLISVPQAVAFVPYTDATQAVVTTIYLGNSQRTKSTMQNISEAYKHFIDNFVSSEFCVGDYTTLEREEGCKKLHAEQLGLIEKKAWSRNFQFTNADFVEERDFGLYRFQLRLDQDEIFSCRFELKISANLKAHLILNHEFIVEKCVPYSRG